MIRLDRFLSDMNIGSRSELKALAKKGCIAVNHVVIKDTSLKIDEQDEVFVNGKLISYQKYFYYMLNKPAGYVSATTDLKEKTVMELLGGKNRKDMFPVGRLDKDTEGFLLLTNDGELAHNLLSPRKHIDKTYYVELEHDLSDDDIANLTNGVDIGDETKTLPCQIKVLGDKQISITIQEGRYHQIKRMMIAVSNKVTYLKRTAMGSVLLDSNLSLGDFRELSKKELEQLREKK